MHILKYYISIYMFKYGLFVIIMIIRTVVLMF